MPQWRKLHTKTLESMDINDMPDDTTRLLWLLMVLVLDKEGRGIDNPAWIKAKAMPLRTDIKLDKITQAMDFFAERKMIIRYTADDRKYFYVPKWHRYQSTSKEAPSEYPDPVEIDSKSGVSPELVRSRENQSGNSHKKISADTSLSLSMSESNIFTVYQQEIGIITPIIAEEILQYVDDIPAELQEHWFTEAIKQSVSANVRKWNYVKAILDNWISSGKITDRRTKQMEEAAKGYTRA